MATPPRLGSLAGLVVSALVLVGGEPAPAVAAGESTAAEVMPWQLQPEERRRLQELTERDHAEMMAQLGIKRLRPGKDGSGKPGVSNAANYDEAKANPYPNYPDPLVAPDGRRIASPESWWRGRRPQIVEDFEREVYGRIPPEVPPVVWRVTRTLTTTIAGRPVRARQVIGQVDNSADPAISVEIRMAVVTPADAPGPVPVLVMFGFGTMPDVAAPAFGPPGSAPAGPPSTEQLIAAGWGYVSLSASSIQADNGAGLTAGIIGLTNRGRPRRPDQWGALRAWGWGAGRALDYLQADPSVDSRRVGIEGVSRYGKAALVTMAFDERFAVALIGSSGEGGAKPHRRDFGEAVENLTGSGEYHWMAGNFLKYGAAEAVFGSRTADDLPVESNELIALCAPRPVFVSYGIPERGDAHWLDHQGSYMATVAAGEVYRLLGARDLGVAEDYRSAKMPPVNSGLTAGELAWRQHDGGHEDRSNMKYFIAWADRMLGRAPGPR
jgi:hypothetical protein